MNIKAILSLASVGLLLYTVYEQNQAINKKKDQIIELKARYDSLYTEHWTLKTYVDLKEGRSQE
jgi:hypothetical protein